MDWRVCDDAAGIRSDIERCFRRIETERMSGVPILNRALRVEAVGLQRFGEEWLSILLTPWFMNVMLLPASPAAGEMSDGARAGAVGRKELVAFPAGRFEMIGGVEAGIGPYRMCSLFSPVLEFADHESAVQAAEVALAALLQSPSEDDADAGMDMIWRGERPSVPRGGEVSEVATDGQDRGLRGGPGHHDDAGGGSKFSRRGLLLGRMREESER
ncbi:MAG: [NiFe]-hydrogenase assembly chaperone HybE [Hyphomicrobiaceae bacterium]